MNSINPMNPINRMNSMNPMNSINPTNQLDSKGFTLLEVLIAVFILAIVFSTIFASYTGTFRIINETESQGDTYEMARIALGRMLEDLESIYFSKTLRTLGPEETAIQPTRFIGENKEIEGKSADSLRFLASAHLIFDEEDEDLEVAEIIYHVKRNDAGDSLVLYRSDTLAFEEMFVEEKSGFILCDGLFSVNFAYYDINGEVYDSWDSTDGNFIGRLPAMISIQLIFENRSNPEAPLKFKTGVALPMAKDKYEKAT